MTDEPWPEVAEATTPKTPQTPPPAPAPAPAPGPEPVPAPALRGLDGARFAFLGATGATILLAALSMAPVDVGAPTRPQWLLLIFGAAASLVQLVASIVWVVHAVENQQRLGHPVPGHVWPYVVAGSLLPFVGPLFLFEFAGRILKASTEAARSDRYVRPSWFAPWFVAYLLATALGDFMGFLPNLEARDGAQALHVVLLAASWFGLVRFLRTVQDEQAAAVGRTPPAPPWESQATAFPDDA